MKKELAHITKLGYWKSLSLAFLKFQNWLGGIFSCLMNLPLIILGGLWGTAYLTHAHGFTLNDLTDSWDLTTSAVLILSLYKVHIVFL